MHIFWGVFSPKTNSIRSRRKKIGIKTLHKLKEHFIYYISASKQDEQHILYCPFDEKPLNSRFAVNIIYAKKKKDYKKAKLVWSGEDHDYLVIYRETKIN
jgi:hypothetical protein